MQTDEQTRRVDLALELLKLGVSGQGVQELLLCDLNVVEKQLAYLPFRKAKRPEAMIVESIRKNFSAPKEFYAQSHYEPSAASLDEDPESPARPGIAQPYRYGASHSLGAFEENDRLPTLGESLSLELPPAGDSHGETERRDFESPEEP